MFMEQKDSRLDRAPEERNVRSIKRHRAAGAEIAVRIRRL